MLTHTHIGINVEIVGIWILMVDCLPFPDNLAILTRLWRGQKIKIRILNKVMAKRVGPNILFEKMNANGLY